MMFPLMMVGGVGALPTSNKSARLDLPASGSTIPAGTEIFVNQANNGLDFEGSTDINLGADAAEFSSRFPSTTQINIAGELADEDQLTWRSPTSFSWSEDIWPGSDIVIEEVS